jgi:hypothetical protein
MAKQRVKTTHNLSVTQLAELCWFGFAITNVSYGRARVVRLFL